MFAFWRRRFAVRGVLWRHYLDFGLTNVPFYLQPVMIFFWTIFFFFLAAPARRAILSNLRVVLPGSSPLLNLGRAWLTLYNFAWTISDAANDRLAQTEFAYEMEGAEFLDQLAAAQGAVLLTAHMGNYDLGAAIFARRFRREIRMVRAPESDEQTAQHLGASLERAGAGAVKVAYNTSSMALPFELLNAIRQGEIVSIQGDRAVEPGSQRAAQLFGQVVRLPDGPFMLAFVTEAPIFPLFIVRASYHRYKIIARAPIYCRSTGRGREPALEAAMEAWCRTLESVVAAHWSQWFSLVPIFPAR
ncbi:MAG TPA: lysophospholipid acyltransferase family protein [Chthoniobacterales bacterium]|nr:lysophospholipid acyltransferase family protein [Chthoniobacterales bacterium]